MGYPQLSYKPHRKFPELRYDPLRGMSFQRVAAEPCEPMSPQYYDLITWFNLPLPDYSFAIEPETKERKIDAVLEKLKEGVAQIVESSVFREFLLTMSKFHNYSIGNQILIMLQRPGATRVAGFQTWKDLERYVKGGEKGIMILAPCLPPRQIKCPLCDQLFSERDLRTHLSEFHQRTDIVALIKTAKEEGAVEASPTYFKVVYVFDVKQTEGKPLPEIEVPVLTGAVNEELFAKVLAHDKEQGLEVSFEPKPNLDPDIKGYYIGKEIWVKGDEPRAQQLKTLIHENGHYYTETVFLIPRADAETIAESSAFVVGAHFGFDSGVRSFPYVAVWAQDKKVLERNLLNIRKVSARMIEALEKEAQVTQSPSTLRELVGGLLLAEVSSKWRKTSDILYAAHLSEGYDELDKLLRQGKVGKARFYGSFESWWSNQALSCPKCGSWNVEQLFTEDKIFFFNRCQDCKEHWRPEESPSTLKEARYGFLQLNEAEYEEALKSGRYPEPKRYEELTGYYTEPHEPGWKGLSLAEMFPTKYKDLLKRGVPDTLSASQAKMVLEEKRIPYERGIEIGDEVVVRNVYTNEIEVEGKVTKITQQEQANIFRGKPVIRSYYEINGKGLYGEDIIERASMPLKTSPSTLKEPFIKVGERVRALGRSRYRYERWPKDKWLEAGVTGTVVEYHPEQPAVRVKGEYFEALPPYAVVQWDLGGEARTCIEAVDEGERWERVTPSTLKEGKPRAMPNLISRKPLFQGRAYRVDIPNWGIPGDATAGDIVRFEQKELGNDFGVSDDLIKELDNYSYSDVVWVTKKKADAEFYLSEGMTKADISEITLGEGARMVAEDGQGGFLVLYGSARPKPSLKEGQISKTRVSSLGFIELEAPVAKAVEALVKENPWSSGFHGALNQRWTIVFRGKISDRAVEAAEAAGLEVSYREAPVGSGQILTDVSLPGVGAPEIERATEAFNKFAELYTPSTLKVTEKETLFQADLREMYDAQKEIVDELRANGYRPQANPSGTLTIYHGTTPENAEAIRKSGRFNEMTFFSHAKSKSAFGSEGAKEYGKEVVAIDVDPRDIYFNGGTGEIEAEKGLVRTEGGIWRAPDRVLPWERSTLKEPIIHEATSFNPDPSSLMPLDVESAFPEGEPSRFSPQEKEYLDRLINEVPDKNDTGAINYWVNWGDRKVYLEGWIDKCLAGTGFPPMGSGEWDQKIDYMVALTHRTLIEKQEEKNRAIGIGSGFLTLIEGGFREFDAGSKTWLYGVSWGVYEEK